MEENAIKRDVVKEPFWSISIEETLSILRAHSAGLSDEEAASRLRFFGPNAIEDGRRISKIRLILNQLKNPLILILILAGGITVLLRDWVDAGVIFAAVLANTLLGFWQENKAENAIELLKSYIRTRARVRRAGKERGIDASELVPGDIIRISQGDRVPADCRLIYVNNFEVDESVLTGESLPVAKNTDALTAGTVLGDRKSMVFGGTLAFQGFADAVATATGSDTEFGEIAKFVTERERELTPLQRSISQLALIAGVIFVSLTILLFALGIKRGYELFEMFFIAVAVAVSAVPEALPVALTAILAVGVERLAKKKGVVRKLLAAETLGSTTLILTDKTGTLTQAKMELSEILPYKKSGIEAENEVVSEALINTDVVIENSEDPPEKWIMTGRPLEIAIVRSAAGRGIDLSKLTKEYKILDRLPFSSEHKFSVAVYERSSTIRLVLLGAPEIILKYTKTTPEERTKIEEDINRRALNGQRVLGVAAKDLPHAVEALKAFIGPHVAHHEEKPQPMPQDLEFKGLLSLKDPLRPEAREAMQRINQAGVRTIIVTGDHQGTAEAISRELGLIDGKGAVLTGADLQYLSDDELAVRAGEVNVYARVSPQQKLKLTNLYKSKGEVVAVTGDGINDAPALSAADIGVAVGSGTDVAKSAADLVLLDDNFQTLVAAIEEGRRILDNIRKVIVYLLSDALDALLIIGGSLIVGVPMPINALQILFVNFFSDSFPAIAIAFETDESAVKSRPSKLSRTLIDRQMSFLIFGIGVFTSFLLFAAYIALYGMPFPKETVKTFIFASFATYTLFLPFAIKSLERSIFQYSPFSNPYLVIGSGIGFVLTACVLYVPFLQRVFGTVPLTLPWIGAVFGIGIINIALVELTKWLFRKKII